MAAISAIWRRARLAGHDVGCLAAGCRMVGPSWLRARIRTVVGSPGVWPRAFHGAVGLKMILVGFDGDDRRGPLVVTGN